MVKCANCSSDAFFAYVITAEFSIPYCSKHIPKFLNKMSASLVKLSAVAPQPSSKKKKVDAPVIEETVEELTPVFEEPVVDEVVDEGELEVTEGE